MNATDVILFNFEEVRRRSIIVWRAIPADKLSWKPDEGALTCAEMIRHILQADFLYHHVLIGRGEKGLANLINPFATKEFISVEDELEFVQPFREQFLKYIKTIHINDYANIEIDLFEAGGFIRTLGDMLLRIPYHEAVHTGQLLDYMRTMGINRPKIWD
ncbi:DinB family protein [Paenibacillus taiwanensis]|uniref:DinB family protein n=1 Tax=Paenibacillus taiwanensis TaxID=401638 RepID=UPI00041B3897|nr:DinB family protein [Paenibacillus taiwanensis]